MAAEDEARKASDAFYAALNRMAAGDARPMADVWSHGADVTAMHPIGGREIGWDNVRTSFEKVAKIASEGRIGLQEQVLRVTGDTACEIGVERGHATFGGHRVTLDHRVTNVYQREAGGWRIVHHHTDVSAPMVDVVRRLQAGR